MENRLQNPVLTAENTPKTEKLLAEVKDMIRHAEEKAVDRAKAADKAIRSHPYQSLGITFALALGLGLAIGFFSRRK